MLTNKTKYSSPHILGMDPLCFTLCFRLITKQKREISELEMWQHFDVAPNVRANKDRLCEATKSHPLHTYIHTHLHTLVQLTQ